MQESRRGWNDLVLPGEVATLLHELASRIFHARKVYVDWQLARSPGSTGTRALFCGPPGTGKTLAAEILANDLRLELHRADLRGVVSKYTGETEKNLDVIFDEATGGDVLLLFDEADTLFGRRSEVDDAHDRYADAALGYLLQRIEAFDGVVVVATNRRANIDPAFLRRFHVVVEFPFPDVAARERIWRAHLVPALAIGDVDCAELAQRYPLDGASIRDAVVDAAFLAADAGDIVDMRHLSRACARIRARVADGEPS